MAPKLNKNCSYRHYSMRKISTIQRGNKVDCSPSALSRTSTKK